MNSTKQVPYSTFSEFLPQRSRSKKAKQMYQGFVDMPNYRLAGRSFDVRHLDRFINQIRSEDSIINYQASDDKSQRSNTESPHREEVVFTDNYGSTTAVP